VLAIGDEDLRPLPLSARRKRLETLLDGVKPPVHLTPYTRDAAVGREWLAQFEGAGLDGIIAKAWEQPYIPGKRGWVKVKHERTADCVVIGYRLYKDGSSLGSLLLGLYDEKGSLHYVGHTSSFDAATRRKLLDSLQPLRMGAEERTKSQDEGEDLLARFGDLTGGRADDHGVRDLGRAGELQAAHALDLDQTHPTTSVGRQSVDVAEARDIGAG